MNVSSRADGEFDHEQHQLMMNICRVAAACHHHSNRQCGFSPCTPEKKRCAGRLQEQLQPDLFQRLTHVNIRRKWHALHGIPHISAHAQPSTQLTLDTTPSMWHTERAATYFELSK
jgi:hypothetical protein